MEQSHYHKVDKQEAVGIGTAHSKIILMGEHAVVYDYPAIALPFPEANISVRITPSADGCSTMKNRYYEGPLNTMPPHLDNLSKAIELTITTFKLTKEPINITIESTIPAGRGMGSSAAVAVALVRALAHYYGINIQDYQLHYIVNEAEVIAHESTSGLDTLLTSSTQPVLYRKSHSPRQFTFNLDAFLVVADSDIEGQTKLAVGKVRQLKENNPEFVVSAMNAIGGFVQQAVDAIQNNNPIELGRLMTYNHYYLNQLEISSPHLDAIVKAAWVAGALGAKLTGGGLGGCVIALAETKAAAQLISEAMKNAGASQTWELDLRMI